MRNGTAYFLVFVAALFGVGSSLAQAENGSEESPALATFGRDIKPLLATYCYECHGNGAKEGNRAFDELEARGEFLSDQKLWLSMLKNIRSGAMPPAGEKRPSKAEVTNLAAWVKKDIFRIDPTHPDPGHTVLRRLNRLEYQNTIRDLLGLDYDVLLHFPPDDTGYGFDTIGEVLMVSPMLTEKYLEAAENIVKAAVPTVTRKPAEKVFSGKDFVDASTADKSKPADGEVAAASRPVSGEEVRFHETADLGTVFNAKTRGKYVVNLDLRIDGQFEYNPLRSHVRFFIDDEELVDKTFVYHDGESYLFQFEKTWEPGEHRLRFEVRPLPPAEDSPAGRKDVFIRFKVTNVRVSGPMESEHWVKPANYDLLYSLDAPPESEAERSKYAREVLAKFATQAFRRPVSDSVVQKLADIAAREYQQPNKTFEAGIARAMIAILASPRYLYRVEGTLPKTEGEQFPLVDEYALASRLSYFLWSTMPDAELLELAKAGKLRSQLDQQVERMIAEKRSRAFVENFAGQWLRTRDVAHVRIDSTAVIAADAPAAERAATPELAEADRQALPGRKGRGLGIGGRRRGAGAGVNFDNELRTAMQQETELQFAYIMRENRSLLEFLDCDYAFLNQRLAELYKIEGVEGPAMRMVKLPPDSLRGGVLTQGSLLTISSNPDRTSPVKRGLFILDNILGSPPPPPPADIPELEESAGKFGDRKPTLREVLELHRENALCTACHARMDPLGLALENFNALGMWRTNDGPHPINAAGSLVTGEKFESIRELKTILKDTKQQDFYYCLTEKMMTYALGRGVECTDLQTIDQIVENLNSNNGRFSELIMGIIHSPQFQRQREPESRSAAVKQNP